MSGGAALDCGLSRRSGGRRPRDRATRQTSQRFIPPRCSRRGTTSSSSGWQGTESLVIGSYLVPGAGLAYSRDGMYFSYEAGFEREPSPSAPLPRLLDGKQCCWNGNVKLLGLGVGVCSARIISSLCSFASRETAQILRDTNL